LDKEDKLSTHKKVLYSSIVAVVFLTFIPLLTKRNDFINLLILIFLFIALAQSWNILAGFTGQISLGHAAFFGVGAITTRFLWVWGVPFLLSFLTAGGVAATFALIIGYPALRLKGHYFAIGTLALSEILRIVIGNVLPIVADLPSDHLATYSLIPRYYLCLMLAVVIVAAVYALSKSKLGLGMLAVREDEETAKASGVNTFRQKIIALVISTFFAGLAGGAFAFYHASYYHDLPFSSTWTFDSLLITSVGGVGTVTGPIIGAFFYAISKEFFARTLPGVHVFIFGILFVVVVLILPGGLVEMASRVRKLFVTGKAAVSNH
jgi:branched-chain amino acid transport system permease protein